MFRNPLHHPNLLLACLLALGTAALATSTGHYLYPALLWILLLLHVTVNLHVPVGPRLLMAALLGVPFAFWLRFLPRGAFGAYQGLSVLYILGFYTLGLGAHHLLTLTRGGSRHQVLGASITGLALAGVAPWNRAYVPIFFLFMPLLLVEVRRALELQGPQRQRMDWRRHGPAIVGLVLLAVLVHSFVVTQVPIINRWAIRQMIEAGAGLPAGGFARSTRLGSVPRHWDERRNQEVVLRRWGPQPREYLRGAAHDIYERGIWQVIAETENVTGGEEGEDRGRTFFNLTEDDSQTWAGTIYVEPQFGDAYFLPLGVHRLSAFERVVRYSEAFSVRSNARGAAGGYRYFDPVSAMPEATPADLGIPAELRQPLAGLAAELLDPQAPVGENAQRIQAYFQTHFRYQIGLTLLTDKDPVLEFLQDLRAGHCEYFASAGALLLRSIGVPARYVSGFVCREDNLGGYWLSRRKDAHAWVEYYHPQRGWLTFDPTPPAAQPPPPPPKVAGGVFDLLSSVWQRITGVFTVGGPGALLAVLWDGATDLLLLVPVPVWLVVVVGGMMWMFRDRVHHMWRGQRRRPVPPHVLRLRAVLREAERLVARHDVAREPGTTAGAFARAIAASEAPDAVKEEAQRLLREYEASRFRPEVTDM